MITSELLGVVNLMVFIFNQSNMHLSFKKSTVGGTKCEGDPEKTDTLWKLPPPLLLSQKIFYDSCSSFFWYLAALFLHNNLILLFHNYR